MERKEALEVVRKNMPTDRSLPVYEALQTLIPELAESEDERLRKDLIAFLIDMKDGNVGCFPSQSLYQRWIALLEKQKETLHIPETCKENADSFTDEDEKIRKGIVNFLLYKAGHLLDEETEHKFIAYLEKQKVIAAIPDELVECYKNLCERGNRGVASLIDAINGFYGRKFAPKFRVGDVMRTKQEAAEEMTDGMPVVVSIDDDYYICNNVRIPIADQEEYEFPPMNTMIQWTGKNLKEVIDFTGKSPKFDEWFKSWEDFENYVHSHGGILKLFFEDGSHYEVPVGAWIVKTPDGYNIPSRFRFIQKPAEWSKEDIVFLNEIIDFFENGTVRLQHDLSMYAHWLKSLRPS